MKTQKFYGITFVYDNFRYEIDRSLLAHILKNRFPNLAAPESSHKLLATEFQMRTGCTTVHLWADLVRSAAHMLKHAHKEDYGRQYLIAKMY